jgi:hypothetical protein
MAMAVFPVRLVWSVFVAIEVGEKTLVADLPQPDQWDTNNVPLGWAYKTVSTGAVFGG